MFKFWTNLGVAGLLAITIMAAPAHAENMAKEQQPVHPPKSNVHLSQQQKQQLSILHKEIYMKRKELISKYVEYGIIPKKKGDKIMKHMERRYQKMERNGFVPKWHKFKFKKGHCD